MAIQKIIKEMKQTELSTKVKNFDESTKRWTLDKRIEYHEDLIEYAKICPLDDLIFEIKRKFLTNQKLARFLVAIYLLRENIIITDYKTDQIKIYDTESRYFLPIGEEKIKQILTQKFKLHNTSIASKEILSQIRNMTYVSDHEIKKSQPLNLIPVKNGIVDLNTGRLLAHDPKYYFDYQIPITYDEKAQCPKIENFFMQLVSENDLPLLYDIFGLSLYRINILEVFFVLIGVGSNGKSKFLTLLEQFVGEGNYSAISLKQLTEDRFAVARTCGKLVNIGADISGRKITDTSMLKSASASDSVSGQFKFGQIFDFIPTATLIFSANNPPVFADDSKGMYRRTQSILFPNRFGNVKDIAEDSMVKKANPKIIEEITTAEELSGLLNKAIDSLSNILKNGQLSVVKSVTVLRNDYIMYSNNVQAFVELYCEEAEYIPADYESLGKTKKKIHDAQGFLTIKEMYPEYCKFCKNRKLVVKCKDGFAKELKKLTNWNLEFNQQDLVNNNKERSIRGIRFKPKVTNTGNTGNTGNTAISFLNIENEIGKTTIRKAKGVLPVLGVLPVFEEIDMNLDKITLNRCDKTFRKCAGCPNLECDYLGNDGKMYCQQCSTDTACFVIEGYLEK